MAKPRKKLSPGQMVRFIRSCYGKYKSPSGSDWAEHKREEKELEEAKFQRMNRASLFPATRTSRKSRFDLYLEKQLKDPGFAARFEKAGAAWDVGLQLTALREKAGLSRKNRRRKLRTGQNPGR